MELPAGVYKRACRSNQAAVDGYWYDAIKNRLLLQARDQSGWNTSNFGRS